jgi:hypothetical protein
LQNTLEVTLFSYFFGFIEWIKSQWIWPPAFCPAPSTPVPDLAVVCGVHADVISAFATIAATLLALGSIFISFQATNKERRFSSITTIKEWFDRNREKFEEITREIDYGPIKYNPFDPADRDKEGKLLSFLSTLNEIAFLVHLGHAKAEDLRQTSLGYWFIRALNDEAIIRTLAQLRVVDRERGHRDEEVFPFLLTVGPKITRVKKHRKIHSRVIKISKQECFIAKVNEALRHPMSPANFTKPASTAGPTAANDATASQAAGGSSSL